MLKETYNFDKKLYSETKKPKSMIPDEAKDKTSNYFIFFFDGKL